MGGWGRKEEKKNRADQIYTHVLLLLKVMHHLPLKSLNYHLNEELKENTDGLIFFYKNRCGICMDRNYLHLDILYPSEMFIPNKIDVITMNQNY